MNLQESIRRILREETEPSKYTKAVQLIVDDFKNEDFVCDIDVYYYADKYEVAVKIDRKEFEKKYENRDISYANILMSGYLDKLKRTIRQEIKNFLPVDVLVWFKQINCDKGLNESETKTNSSLHRLLNMLFDGFDNADYDWANYMCGMGECCDPYAIGFTLPEKDYDDYIFKLVDGEMYDDDADYPAKFRDELPEVCYESPVLKDPKFDTIVFYGLYAEEIEDYMGHAHNWNLDLLKIINKQFGCDAKRIVII